MKYLGTSEIAAKWNVSERSVRNYCAEGRIPGAVLDGKTWLVPSNSKKPPRKKRTCEKSIDLLSRIKLEKDSKMSGGIYHKIQIEFTYNSNHIEGSRLTHDQTRYIFETNTIGINNRSVNVDEIIEASNHFRCIDYIIDMANYKISEAMIKQLHMLLKSGTSDSRKSWFAVGEYKKLENEVGGSATTSPKNVSREMKRLITNYNKKKEVTLKEIVEFHYKFEKIHPFQDGNGRIGRLIIFKECLRCGITPFIIEDDIKEYYYRGLGKWKSEPGYLMDTCLTAQDRFGKLIGDLC